MLPIRATDKFEPATPFIGLVEELPDSAGFYATRHNRNGNRDYLFDLEKADSMAIVGFIADLVNRNQGRVQVALDGPVEPTDIVLTVVKVGNPITRPLVDLRWLLDLWKTAR